MKRILSIAIVGCVTTLSAPGQYVTKANSGTTSCQVNFPAVPGSQGRVASVSATSDKAASVLSFRTGVGAWTIGVATNAAATNVFVNTTNGFAANDIVVIQKSDGTLTNLTVHSTSSYSNVNFTTATGVTVAAGDQLFEWGSATTIPVGNATLTIGTDAIYAGNRGRPIRIVLDGTSACAVNAATVKQD